MKNPRLADSLTSRWHLIPLIIEFAFMKVTAAKAMSLRMQLCFPWCSDTMKPATREGCSITVDEWWLFPYTITTQKMDTVCELNSEFEPVWFAVMWYISLRLEIVINQVNFVLRNETKPRINRRWNLIIILISGLLFCGCCRCSPTIWRMPLSGRLRGTYSRCGKGPRTVE